MNGRPIYNIGNTVNDFLKNDGFSLKTIWDTKELRQNWGHIPFI